MRLRILIRNAAFLAGSAVVALILYRVRQIYVNESGYMNPVRGSIAVPLDSARVPGLSDVIIRNEVDGRDVSAWYLAPRAGAVVILAHGTEADRSSMLPEIRILAAAGIGVLAFDWPGYAMSDGKPESDEEARNALRAVITWTTGQPGVDPARLGALGFSYGGYRLAQVAGRDARIRNVALLAVPPDGASVTYYFYRKWTPAAGWLALQFDRYLGSEPDSLKPRDMVALIAPRPILFVIGDQDPTVPLSMARRVFDYAKEPKELLTVRGAGHGGYANASPAEYPSRLVRFFAPTDSSGANRNP